MKQKQRLSDLKVMSNDQLEQELLNLKKEQFNLRFQRASGQLENTARFRVVRRDIARILTVLGQTGASPVVARAKPAEKTAKAPAKKAAAPKAAKKPAKRASAKT